ncbi:luciferin 4-monooxygenase isoform X2 [Folsomia candida]|uniref:luciferin 4-monooxygenase isoform X2 n=1 Tax=Folsomia candida TaxID=158441 RepID=UPI000B8FA51A|nr:luciferin 4-monooxygenase isoform X2 [Folsomia candida]
MSDTKFEIKSEYTFRWPRKENTALEYILRRLSEHVANGREKCITNPDTDESLTFKELQTNSKQIAGGLYNLGFRTDDTLIYLTNNVLVIHSLILGVWRANGTARASYCEEIQDALLDRVIESKSKWIACDESILAEVLHAISKAPWSNEIKVIVLGDHDNKREREGCYSLSSFLQESVGQDCPPLEIGPDSAALIVPTSGTTGLSKGAVYSQSSLLQNILAFEYTSFTDDPKTASILGSKPTHFIGSAVAFSYICGGRYLLQMASVTVPRLFSAIQKYQARSLFLFPKFILELVAEAEETGFSHVSKDLRSVAYLATGGHIITPEAMTIMKKFPNLKHFVDIYGMTECGLITSSSDWDALLDGKFEALKDLPPYSVGKLIPGVQLKVVHVETGVKLGPMEKGELCIKTDLICNGYIHRPEDNAITFQDGWLFTGDVGYYDEKGFIYIVDRNKDIFRFHQPSWRIS